MAIKDRERWLERSKKILNSMSISRGLERNRERAEEGQESPVRI